ncbi:ABC transporter substrate-binding protein [Variovorax sp. CAN2819]|uniref:ABC transporter substrate-binding protein n=1 Tax=Variovorax sp. CAN15 TaxID=3046727 RepID=UPI0026478F65|nr:ABC transporter substrate-binding protein [Variovorax sp. CAN15]MDN6886343.1 ABC transporter substrate-binding protein [Variovorax sp. CAN15]
MKKTFTSCAAALFLAMAAAGASAQILIGQSADLSGPVAASVKETIMGSQLVIDQVNAQGGINGEQIEVIRMDDGLDAKRSLENTRVLIEDKKVVALLLNRGTPNTLAVIPLLDKHGVALVGPSTGAMALHKPVQKNIFNVRSTYQREAEKAVQHLQTTGIQRIAVVQADDSFGKDAMEGANKGFEKANLKPAVVALADRSKPDYTAIVPQLTKANAQAVLWIGSGTAVTDGIKALRAAGSAAQIITLSNNAASGFIRELGSASAGVIVTQVLPYERAFGHPLIKEALALAKAKGQNELSPALLEGFVATKVMVEALRRTGPKPTRAKLIATLNSFQYDVGGGLDISYSPTDHTGIDYVDLSIVSDGKFKR